MKVMSSLFTVALSLLVSFSAISQDCQQLTDPVLDFNPYNDLDPCCGMEYRQVCYDMEELFQQSNLQFGSIELNSTIYSNGPTSNWISVGDINRLAFELNKLLQANGINNEFIVDGNNLMGLEWLLVHLQIL